jgi:hypothetical protein
VFFKKPVMASITRDEGAITLSFQSSFNGLSPAGSWEMAVNDETASYGASPLTN